jgi:hypothetical protein
MPIQLTTAFNPGDLDTVTYTQVKITKVYLSLDSKSFEIRCQYGNTVETAWVKGVVDDRNFNISGTDYDTLIAATPEAEETTYDAAARELYQWLLDNDKFVGTIV